MGRKLKSCYYFVAEVALAKKHIKKLNTQRNKFLQLVSEIKGMEDIDKSIVSSYEGIIERLDTVIQELKDNVHRWQIFDRED